MDEGKLELNFKVPKNINWTWVFLAIFLVLGLYLRAYHLDYPTIGYHNLKENEYVDEARFFMNEGNWLHKQTYTYYGLDEGLGYHEEYAEVPYVAYLTAIGWMIFGESLWLPRLFMILFMLGSILLTYSVVRKLTKNEYLSLLSSFLMTIMPLGIYFGRSIQPESPGLFFILLTAHFFVKWLDTKERMNLMYSGLAFSVAIGLKYPFGIIAVPLFFILPFSEIHREFKERREKLYADAKYLVYGIIPGIFTTLLYELTVIDSGKVSYNVDLLRIFSTEYWSSRWPSLMSYFNDNYTTWFMWFAIIGLVFAILKYKTRFSKFLIGYAFSVFIYSDIMAAKIGGHSYYQMPFLPLVCILSAYFLYIMGTILSRVLKSKYALYVPLILIFMAAPAMMDANDRVWGTNFYGQDFLGGYLKTRLGPDERLIAQSHAQDLATCSYSRHRCGGVSTVEGLKRAEEVFGSKYIYIGISEMGNLNGNDPLWVYIKENYMIDLVGLIYSGNDFVPYHIILKRGGEFNTNDIQGKTPEVGATYDTKQGVVTYYYIRNV